MVGSSRRLASLLLFAALVIGQYLFFRGLISSGQLPNPIAIHWGISGQPDGFSDPTDFLRGVTVAYLSLLVLMAVGAFTLKRRLLGPLLFGFLAFFLILLALGFSITMLVQVGKNAQEVSVSGLAWILILFLPLVIVFVVLRFPTVSLGKDLRVKVLGITVLRLDFQDLKEVSETDLRARDFGGLGIRYAKKTLAFIPRSGKGVLIETNFGESIAIRSNSPELLNAAIRARIEKS